MAEQIAEDIGAAIRQVRERVNVTAAELAKRLGVRDLYVYRWQSGERQPSLETIAQIEMALGVPKGAVLRAAGLVENECSDTVRLSELSPKIRQIVETAVELDRAEATLVQHLVEDHPETEA